MIENQPGSTSLQYRRRARLARVSAAASVLPVWLGLAYWALRWGFPTDIGAIVRTVGLSLFLANAPLAWWDAWLITRAKERWYASPACGALIVLGASLLVGGSGGSITGWAITVIGFLLGGRHVFWAIREGGRPSASSIILGAAVLLWVAGISWGLGPRNPLYVENISLHGGASTYDALFYSAMSNMYRTYGVLSTGIDGIPPIVYHVGSNWMFAQWSALIGVPVLDFFQFGFDAILSALWLVAFWILVEEIFATRSVRSDPRIPRGPVLAILAAAVIGVMPPPASYLGSFGYGPLLSESYGTSMMLAFLLAALTLHVVRASLPDRHENVNAGVFAGAFFRFLVIPLGFVTLAYLKVSVAALTFLVFAWSVIRVRLLNRKQWFASVLLTIVALVLALPRVLPQGYGSGFALFSYLEWVLPRLWWPFFLSVHLFWTWLYSAARIHQARDRLRGGIWSTLRSGALLDVELLVVVSAAGLLPGLIMTVGLDGFSFGDFQRWMAVALLVGDGVLLMKLEDRWRQFRSDGLLGFTFVRIAAVFIVIPFVATFAITVFRWPAEMLRMNAATRREALAMAQGETIGVRTLAKRGEAGRLADPHYLSLGMSRSRGGDVVSQLQAISRWPSAEKQRTALYVPKTISAFWTILHEEDRCSFAEMVVPALAEVAMIDGLPPAGCAVHPRYGMPSYARQLSGPRVENRSDVDLCAMARERGFVAVAILEPVSTPGTAPSRFAVRKLSC